MSAVYSALTGVILKSLHPALRTKTTKKFRRSSYNSFSCFIYRPWNLINYEKGAGCRSWNQYFRILHKILVKLDQKYVVYNALLPETDDSLIKNQRTTFVVLVQSAYK